MSSIIISYQKGEVGELEESGLTSYQRHDYCWDWRQWLELVTSSCLNFLNPCKDPEECNYQLLGINLVAAIMNCHQLRGLKQHKLITLSFCTSEVQKWVLQRCVCKVGDFEKKLFPRFKVAENWQTLHHSNLYFSITLSHWPSPFHSLGRNLVITRGCLW